MSLRSSTEKLGDYVTQIIHFSNGNKRTFEGIDTKSIKQGEFTKMYLKDGRLLMINTANVDCIEVFSEHVEYSGSLSPSLIRDPILDDVKIGETTTTDNGIWITKHMSNLTHKDNNTDILNDSI